MASKKRMQAKQATAAQQMAGAQDKFLQELRALRELVEAVARKVGLTPVGEVAAPGAEAPAAAQAPARGRNQKKVTAPEAEAPEA